MAADGGTPIVWGLRPVADHDAERARLSLFVLHHDRPLFPSCVSVYCSLGSTGEPHAFQPHGQAAVRERHVLA